MSEVSTVFFKIEATSLAFLSFARGLGVVYSTRLALSALSAYPICNILVSKGVSVSSTVAIYLEHRRLGINVTRGGSSLPRVEVLNAQRALLLLPRFLHARRYSALCPVP